MGFLFVPFFHVIVDHCSQKIPEHDMKFVNNNIGHLKVEDGCNPLTDQQDTG